MAISDVALARSVLAAIDADPVLKDVNLIVSIVDRAAVIGGPVVSEDVKKRVEQVVRGVAGVESVKNVCFVQTEPDPLLRAIAQRLKPDAKSSSSASTMVTLTILSSELPAASRMACMLARHCLVCS